VGEGDPEGATLAYPVGAEVEDRDADAYDKLRGGKIKDVASEAYTDDDVRDLLRRRQAGDPTARTPLGESPVLVHGDLATELADEARVLANMPPDVANAEAKRTDSDRKVAEQRLYRTDDGDLVHEGDPKATRLAYAVGDPIADGDVDEVDDLGAPQNGDNNGGGGSDDGTDVPPKKPAPVKATKPAAPGTSGR
jgi:hypothetical protein